MIETERLTLRPLTYDQLVKYIKCDHSLEEELHLNETSRTISPALKEAFEQTILPNVADKTKNYLYTTLWTAILKSEKKIVADLCIVGEPNENGEIEIYLIKNPIELVVVNLYPFVETINRVGCALADAIENIDIGGPTLIRAAAKNYQHVTVITEPEDYSVLLAELDHGSGAVSDSRRFYFAQKAFTHTARYDSAISNYLTAIDADGQHTTFPEHLNLNFSRVQTMRYGENPHQQAVFYRDGKSLPGSLANYTQLQGKELSFNNIADTDAAWECVKSFDKPACVIVKHANPCGVAIADNLLAAYQFAFATDPTSAFGGILIANNAIDVETAQEINHLFCEVVIAPAFTDEALEILKEKKNRIILTLHDVQLPQQQVRTCLNGVLVQDRNSVTDTQENLKLVTKKTATQTEIDDLLFASKICKNTKSNTIVLAKNNQLIASGTGQTSRVDALKQAIEKAHSFGFNLKNAVMASDAFFPFPDCVEIAHNAGITVVIQPGGSIKDELSIAYCNHNNIAMFFTGTRHFKH